MIIYNNLINNLTFSVYLDFLLKKHAMYHRISIKHLEAKNQYVESVKLILIALTWLINVLKVFVARVIGQFNFLDVPTLTTRGLENKNHASRENIMGLITFLFYAKIRLLQKIKKEIKIHFQEYFCCCKYK